LRTRCTPAFVRPRHRALDASRCGLARYTAKYIGDGSQTPEHPPLTAEGMLRIRESTGRAWPALGSAYRQLPVLEGCILVRALEASGAVVQLGILLLLVRLTLAVGVTGVRGYRHLNGAPKPSGTLWTTVQVSTDGRITGSNAWQVVAVCSPHRPPDELPGLGLKAYPTWQQVHNVEFRVAFTCTVWQLSQPTTPVADTTHAVELAGLAWSSRSIIPSSNTLVQSHVLPVGPVICARLITD
jgi:hypothetical protein